MTASATSQMSEELLEEAAQWFARLQAEDSSASDAEDCAAWLRQSDEHMRAYRSIERTWSRAGVVGASYAGRDLPVPEARTPRTGSPARYRALAGSRLRRGALAALAACAVLAVILTMHFRPSVTTYQTAVGERRTVVLSDGSSLHLNTGTQVSVVMSARSRRVALEQGEVFLEVAHDTARPFFVAAGSGLIKVVGTRFAVRRAASGTQVSVLSGIVAVASNDDARPLTGPSHVTLTAGQRVAYSQDGTLAPVQSVDPTYIASWRDGVLSYQRVPIADIIADLNRYFVGEIRVQGELPRMPYNAIIRLSDKRSTLAALEKVMPVDAIAVNDNLTVVVPESEQPAAR